MALKGEIHVGATEKGGPHFYEIRVEDKQRIQRRPFYVMGWDYKTAALAERSAKRTATLLGIQIEE